MYAWREWQSTMWAPVLPWLQATADLMAKIDGIPHAAPCRQFAAGCDLLVRLIKHYDKPQFGLTHTEIAGQRIAVRKRIVLEKAFCRLVRFERATECRHPVVLVVAPLSSHHATLLRDTVQTMLPDFDVHIIDWLDARHVPLARGTFHLDDYVAYVQEFIEFLGPDVHVVAVCQSTVPVLSKPLDRFARTLINTVLRPHAGAGRKVYPGFRQHTAFVSMNPDRHLQAHVDYFHDVSAGDTEAANKHRTFYDEYNAVLDMAAEYYLDTVASCFRISRSRAERGWSMASECVPKRFATPY